MTKWAELPDAERIRLLEAEIINLHVTAETRQRTLEEQDKTIHNLSSELLKLKVEVSGWKAQRQYQ